MNDLTPPRLPPSLAADSNEVCPAPLWAAGAGPGGPASPWADSDWLDRVDLHLRQIRATRRRARRRRNTAAALIATVVTFGILAPFTGWSVVTSDDHATGARASLESNHLGGPSASVAGRVVDCDVAELVPGVEAGLIAVGVSRCDGRYALTAARRQLDFGYEEVFVVFFQSGDGWDHLDTVIPAECERFVRIEPSFPVELCTE